MYVQRAGLRRCSRLFTTQPRSKISDEEQLRDWQNAKPYISIPGDGPLKFLSRFLPGGSYYKKTFGDLLTIGQQLHGDIYVMRGIFGRPDTVITTNPEDFEKCFRNEGIWPNRRGLETVIHFRKDIKTDFYKGAFGLVSSSGEEWAKFRSAVNPVLMNPKSMKTYLPEMNKINKEFVQRIREIRNADTLQVPATFENEINRWTFESIAAVAVDKHLGLIRQKRENPTAEKLFLNFKTFFRLFVQLDMIHPPIWKFIKTKQYREMMDCLESIHEITEGYCNEAMAHMQNKPMEDNTSGGSVFEKLLKVDKKIAVVMAMDLLLAGVDTTTPTLASILVSLAANSDKQDILRKEILQILPQKDSDLHQENMSNLPYLRACIKESMRMFPLGTGNLRSPVCDLVLSGYQVPKGTDVAMNSQILMRNAKFYPRPNEFLPERWLRSTDSMYPSTKATHPFVFLPFGFGPRMCAGKRIVDLEIETVIAILVRNFKIEFDQPIDDVFVWDPFLRPAIPLTLKFKDLDD